MDGESLRSAGSWQAYERALKESSRRNRARIARIAEEKMRAATTARGAARECPDGNGEAKPVRVDEESGGHDALRMRLASSASSSRSLRLSSEIMRSTIPKPTAGMSANIRARMKWAGI